MVKKKVSNKGMNKNLIIGIIVVALLLVGGFLYFNNQKEVGLSPAGSPPLKVVGIKGGGIFSYQKTDLCPTMILNSKGEKLLDEFPLAYFYLKSSKDIVLGNLRLQVGRYHESVDARLDIIEDYRAVIYNLKTPWEQEDLGVIESYVDKGRVYVRWDDLSVELEKGQKYGLAIIVNLNKKFNVDDLVEVFLALTKTGHNYHLSDDNSISYKTINGAPRASKTTVFDRANCPLVPNPDICNPEEHVYLDGKGSKFMNMGDTKLINGHKITYEFAFTEGEKSEYFFKVDGKKVPVLDLHEGNNWQDQADITKLVGDGHNHIAILQSEGPNIETAEASFTLTCGRGSCNDTDGGINYAKKGNVSGKSQAGSVYGPGAGFIGGFVDSCSDKESITEWYCDGINPKVSNYACPNGCFNGACLDKN
jgi:hypothetical protein